MRFIVVVPRLARASRAATAPQGGRPGIAPRVRGNHAAAIRCCGGVCQGPCAIAAACRHEGGRPVCDPNRYDGRETAGCRSGRPARSSPTCPAGCSPPGRTRRALQDARQVYPPMTGFIQCRRLLRVTHGPGVRLVTVGPEREGQRIDNCLAALLKGVPRSLIYRLLRTGQVRVNGKRAKPDTRLSDGDQLRIPPVRTAAESEPGLPPQALADSVARAVIYEDQRLPGGRQAGRSRQPWRQRGAPGADRVAARSASAGAPRAGAPAGSRYPRRDGAGAHPRRPDRSATADPRGSGDQAVPVPPRRRAAAGEVRCQRAVAQVRAAGRRAHGAGVRGWQAGPDLFPRDAALHRRPPVPRPRSVPGVPIRSAFTPRMPGIPWPATTSMAIASPTGACATRPA